MKRALALALTILGLSLAGNSPASAAAGSLSGIVAPLGGAPANAVTSVGWDDCGQCCWWDWPIIGVGVAFWELARDEEINFHCCNQRYGTQGPAESTYNTDRYDYPRSPVPRRYRSW